MSLPRMRVVTSEALRQCSGRTAIFVFVLGRCLFFWIVEMLFMAMARRQPRCCRRSRAIQFAGALAPAQYSTSGHGRFFTKLRVSSG